MMISQSDSFKALAGFLIEHSRRNKIGTLTIDNIMKTACLILGNNYFAHNNRDNK